MKTSMVVTRRGTLLGSAAILSLAAARASVEPMHIAVTKGTGCDCCEKWASYLRAHGYTVSMTETDDLDTVKNRLSIPDDLRACHTGQIGDYILEGHVPAVAIPYLLRERPEGMIGVAVPGMPIGAPGMEVRGARLDEYEVILFGPAGRKTWATFKGMSQI